MNSSLMNLNFLPLFTAIIFCVAALSFLYFSWQKVKEKNYVVKSFFFLFSFLLLVATYSGYCNILDSIYYIAPKKDDSFQDVISRSRWPFLVDKITKDGHVYVELLVFPGVVQSIVRVTSLRSGMPAYIFDMNGHLIDCTIDNYDDPSYQMKWENPKSRSRISIDEAYILISK